MKKNENMKKRRLVWPIVIVVAVLCVTTLSVAKFIPKYTPLPVYTAVDGIVKFDNVKINFNPMDVYSKYNKDTVKIYKADDFIVDEAKLQNVLWGEEVKVNDDEFFGNTYMKENKYINVENIPHDIIAPNFSYGDNDLNIKDALQTYTVYEPETTRSTDNCINIDTRQYYKENKNLDGKKSYKEWEEELLGLFGEIGIENVEAETSYAIENDVTKKIIKTQKENIPEYSNFGFEGFQKALDSLDENSEYYRMFFRQSVDSIPICNGLYSPLYGHKGSYIYATVSDAISELRFYGCKKIGEPVKEVEILSATEALDTLIKRYNSDFKHRQVEIESMNLNYYARPSENGYLLEPIWVFNIREEIDGENEYGYRMVDAVDGEMSRSGLRDIAYATDENGELYPV